MGERFQMAAIGWAGSNSLVLGYVATTYCKKGRLKKFSDDLF